MDLNKDAKTPVLFYQEGTCALGAMISLLWLDRPFYLCRLEDEDNEDPNFLELNALGEVPLLYLDGTIVTENVSVLQHIALLGLDKKLGFAPGTPEFDQFNRALGFLSSSFHKSFFPVFHGEKLSKDKNAQKEIRENQINGQLKYMFQHVNDHLLRTRFMYDNPMPIDAYLFATARWGNDFYDMAKEFPHIKRFQDAMAEDEKVKFALKIESGKITFAKGSFLGHKDFKTFTKEASARKLEVDEKNHDGEFTPGLKTEPANSKENKSGAI